MRRPSTGDLTPIVKGRQQAVHGRIGLLREDFMTVQQRFDTHDIFNQSPPFENIDLFATDRALQEAVAANRAGAEAAALSEFGRRRGTAAMFDAARLANENTPKLKVFDTKG